MAKYKVGRMNTGFGEFTYTVNREENYPEGKKLIPVQPIRYYKSKKNAERRVLQLMK